VNYHPEGTLEGLYTYITCLQPGCTFLVAWPSKIEGSAAYFCGRHRDTNGPHGISAADVERWQQQYRAPRDDATGETPMAPLGALVRQEVPPAPEDAAPRPPRVGVPLGELRPDPAPWTDDDLPL
jgi:hypothetical protein